MTIDDLPAEWKLPAGPGTWWDRAAQGGTELSRALDSIQAGEEIESRLMYRRIIVKLKHAGNIGNGYYDFEGPLAGLVRVGLIEVISTRKAYPGEVSPSCVGPGTWSVPKGSPVTWTIRLTELGEAVREYWHGRSPYSGKTPAEHKAEIDAKFPPETRT